MRSRLAMSCPFAGMTRIRFKGFPRCPYCASGRGGFLSSLPELPSELAPNVGPHAGVSTRLEIGFGRLAGAAWQHHRGCEPARLAIGERQTALCASTTARAIEQAEAETGRKVHGACRFALRRIERCARILRGGGSVLLNARVLKIVGSRARPVPLESGRALD